MNTIPGAHDRCRDKENCTGPGCTKFRPERRKPATTETTEETK